MNYKLKFYTTTKYPTGNEELDKEILANLPTNITLCDEELNKYVAAGKTNRITSVALYQGSVIQPESLLASATVRRYFKDIDIPVLGKKYAVEKLIAENDFTREQRKGIWKAFWKHSPSVEALRHGAFKEEIIQIKQADRWRNWEKEIGLRVK